MKMEDREFEELLKKAVCSYHEEELEALKRETEKNIRLSDIFYERMNVLMRRQKHFRFQNVMHYAATVACFVILSSGLVGMAAYALMGAENFKTFFQRNADECQLQNCPAMDLEQLTDMAVTKTGTVYEDEQICLELDGMIKSGDMLSMILKGTLKQQKSIAVPQGPQEKQCYSFLDASVDIDGDLSSSIRYYYAEDDDCLADNQFVYLATYTAEEGFCRDQYTFTFEDFGYYESDMEDVALEQMEEGALTDETGSVSVSSMSYEETEVAVCEGKWEFSVNMDQAQDISVVRTYDLTANDGVSDICIKSVRLSPLGCTVTIRFPGSPEDTEEVDYFNNTKILLKNGSYLDDTCYQMTLSETSFDADKGGAEESQEIKREVTFEFVVPIDIWQVEAVEVFGTDCEIKSP